MSSNSSDVTDKPVTIVDLHDHGPDPVLDKVWSEYMKPVFSTHPLPDERASLTPPHAGSFAVIDSGCEICITPFRENSLHPIFDDTTSRR